MENFYFPTIQKFFFNFKIEGKKISILFDDSRKNQVKNQVKNKVKNEVINQVQNQVKNQMKNQVNKSGKQLR